MKAEDGICMSKDESVEPLFGRFRSGMQPWDASFVLAEFLSRHGALAQVAEVQGSVQESGTQWNSWKGKIGVELGAHIIKTKNTGSEETFRTVVDNCYQPILILGGSKLDDERALFSMVKSAMDAGAAGAVIGRNIWGHQNPRALVEALNQIIHGNISIDEALDVLNAS